MACDIIAIEKRDGKVTKKVAFCNLSTVDANNIVKRLNRLNAMFSKAYGTAMSIAYSVRERK